jgi:hypothetical protein
LANTTVLSKTAVVHAGFADRPSSSSSSREREIAKLNSVLFKDAEKRVDKKFERLINSTKDKFDAFTFLDTFLGGTALANTMFTACSEAKGRAAIAAFTAAAQAAEAAQQQLLGDTSSPFGQLLARHPLLSNIATLYSQVQAAHHRAVLLKLEQHGPAAATTPALAYVCMKEASFENCPAESGIQDVPVENSAIDWSALFPQRVDQPDENQDLQPGQQVTLGDFYRLRMKLLLREVQLTATDRGTQREAAAITLAMALGPIAGTDFNQAAQQAPQQSTSDLQVFVLQDMQTLLQGCLQAEGTTGHPAQSDGAGSGSWFSASSGTADGASAELDMKQVLVQLLEQAHSRLSKDYQRPAASYNSSHQFRPPLRLSHLDQLVTQLSEAW